MSGLRPILWIPSPKARLWKASERYLKTPTTANRLWLRPRGAKSSTKREPVTVEQHLASPTHGISPFAWIRTGLTPVRTDKARIGLPADKAVEAVIKNIKVLKIERRKDHLGIGTIVVSLEVALYTVERILFL